MRRFFTVCILLSIITFNCFSQDSYFKNDSWKNILKLAEKRNQVVMVYLYSDDNKCFTCDELENEFFSDSMLMKKYSQKVILFKTKIQTSQGKRIANMFNGNQTPVIFLVRPNGSLFRKMQANIFFKEIIVNFLDQGINEYAVFNNYSQNLTDTSSIKKYIIQRISYGKQWDNRQILESYLQKISSKQQETDETLDLILKAGFYLNGIALDVIYRHLGLATADQNILKLYIIKEKLFDNIIETINRGTLESKVNLKKAIEITETVNKISPYFKIYDKPMLELIYHANAKNKSVFIKLAKKYFAENEDYLTKDKLRSNDSLYTFQIKKLNVNNYTLAEKRKELVNLISNFSSNNEASKLTVIAKVILYQHLHPRNISFGIKCAKKAIEISPNATRLAIYGLLCDKNENYKNAYDALLEAIELANDKNDKIDPSISDYVFATFLKIKNKIPENF